MTPSKGLGGGGPEDGIPSPVAVATVGKGSKQRWGAMMGGCAWPWRGVMGRLRRQGCADITPGRWRRGKGSGKGKARETAEGRELHREWAPGRGKRCSGWGWGAAGQGGLHERLRDHSVPRHLSG